MDEIEDTEEIFHAAADFVKSNAGSFQQESLLKLYARFKQAKVGQCNVKRPGLFDFQGKQKWDAWNKLGDMNREQAMREYVQEVALVHPDWESQLKPLDKARSPKQMMLGVAVSTMVNTDLDIDDELKTVFDWCKDGNAYRVSRLLEDNETAVDTKDSEGMTLLHWACDRGDYEMVTTLLKNHASVDIQDAEGQTPLHFAVICEHPEIVKLLLSRNASQTIQDCEGQTVIDLDTNPEIKSILACYPVR